MESPSQELVVLLPSSLNGKTALMDMCVGVSVYMQKRALSHRINDAFMYLEAVRYFHSWAEDSSESSCV